MYLIIMGNFDYKYDPLYSDILSIIIIIHFVKIFSKFVFYVTSINKTNKTY